jgi:hypothetical protein
MPFDTTAPTLTERLACETAWTQADRDQYDADRFDVSVTMLAQMRSGALVREHRAAKPYAPSAKLAGELARFSAALAAAKAVR